MKRLAFVLVLLCSNCFAATAFWTGEMRYVTTVTYQQAIACKYSYAGNEFWRVFQAPSCPASVEVI